VQHSQLRLPSQSWTTVTMYSPVTTKEPGPGRAAAHPKSSYLAGRPRPQASVDPSVRHTHPASAALSPAPCGCPVQSSPACPHNPVPSLPVLLLRCPVHPRVAAVSVSSSCFRPSPRGIRTLYGIADQTTTSSSFHPPVSFRCNLSESMMILEIVFKCQFYFRLICF